MGSEPTTQELTEQRAAQTQIQQSMTTRRDGVFMPGNLAEMVEFSKMISSSGIVPKHYVGNPGACIVAMQMGCELGLSPMTSLRSIYVVNGKPTLWGDSMLALIVSRKDCQEVKEWADGDLKQGTYVAKCLVKRNGHDPVEREFSVDDAKTAGLLAKSGPWSQYPKRMLQMRARGFALRDSYPDALTGIYTAEEAADMRPIDMQANFVEPGGEQSALGEGSHSFGFKGRAAPAKDPEPKPAPQKKPEPKQEPKKQEAAKPQQRAEPQEQDQAQGEFDHIGPPAWDEEDPEAGF